MSKTSKVPSIDNLINYAELVIKKSSLEVQGLYQCQKEALQQVLQRYFTEHYVRGIIQMPTGTGKTIVAAALILAFWRYYATVANKKRLLAIFTAPRSVIEKQTYRKFRDIARRFKCIEVFSASIRENTALGGKTIAVCNKIQWFLLKSYSRCKTDGLVAIMTAQLLAQHVSKKCFSTLKKHVDILILDEIHTFYTGNIISDTVKELVSKSKIPVIVGLSATPIREARALLGGIIYSKSSKEAMAEKILTPKLKVVRYKTNIYNIKVLNRTTFPHNDKDLWRLAIKKRAEKYAEIIIDELRKITAEIGRPPKTLVVAPNTREADFLYHNLKRYLQQLHRKDMGNIYTIVAHYKSNNPHRRIEIFKEKKSGILITVNMADIGFDDPDLEVLILARPIRNPISYVQLRGRVLRRATSQDNLKNKKEYALIVELTGETNIEKLEREVPRVEKGRYGREILLGAIQELKGPSSVQEADANKVEVRKLKEIEITPTNQSIDLPIESRKTRPIRPLTQISPRLREFTDQFYMEAYTYEINNTVLVNIKRTTRYKELLEKLCKKKTNDILIKIKISKINKENLNNIKQHIKQELRRDLENCPYTDGSELDTYTESVANIMVKKLITLLKVLYRERVDNRPITQTKQKQEIISQNRVAYVSNYAEDSSATTIIEACFNKVIKEKGCRIRCSSNTYSFILQEVWIKKKRQHTRYIIRIIMNGKIIHKISVVNKKQINKIIREYIERIAKDTCIVSE